MDTATTTASEPKRSRTDAAAVNSSETATTPMAAAKESLRMSVVSLQSEIATLLSKLGNELVVALHKRNTKQRQVSKFESDDEFIPKSARVKFELKCSKLVEQDEEYLSLVEKVSSINDKYQKDLRDAVKEETKLEVIAQTRAIKEILSKNIRLAIKTLLVADTEKQELCDKYFVSTVNSYIGPLLVTLETTTNDFVNDYKRINTIAALPPAFVTELPLLHGQNNDPNNNNALPPQAVLNRITNIGKILESTFVKPWNCYIDVQKRNKTTESLKKLTEEFFQVKSTDDTQMEIDQEPSADPQLLKSLIQTEVLNQFRKAANKKVKKSNNNKTKREQFHNKKNTKKGSGNGGKAVEVANVLKDRNPKKKKKTNRKKSNRSSTNNRK